MIELNLFLIDDHLDELERRIKELQKSESFVGYDISQGIHKESNMPYTNLMALMSAGYSPKNLPARPIMLYAANAYPLEDSSMKKDLTKYFTQIDKSKAPISVTQINENWVNGYAQVALMMFGSTTIFESNASRTIAQKGFNAPLVDKGDLRDNLGYRINNGTFKLVKNL